MPPQNVKNQKAANSPPQQKANSKPPSIPKKGSQRPVGRPKRTRPFKTFHTLSAGETRNSPFTNPNIIFFAGGALMIAADIARIKKVFQYAWGGNALADAKKNPSDFWANLKVIIVQLVFLFLITMSARVIPPLGRMWLIIIIGLWILFLMRNPQILKMLQAAGSP
jgi:hypothetical protein